MLTTSLPRPLCGPLATALTAARVSAGGATVPDAPMNVTVFDAGDGAAFGGGVVEISFDASLSDGGSAILSYTATSTPGGLTGTTADPGDLFLTVEGLTGGVEYTFTVHATNANGNSAESAASDPITPVTVPEAPTIDSVTDMGGGEVQVAFTPGGNGGSAITSYTAFADPPDANNSGLSPITVTVGVLDIEYTFTVIAINDAGDSLPSAPSEPITPT